MAININTNSNLFSITKSSIPKLKDPTDEDEKKEYVKELKEYAKESKEARKQQLLSSAMYSSDTQGKEEDGLSKLIKNMKKQRQSLKSRLTNSNTQQRKSLQGQISLVDSQLQSLELKQLEILRAEAGL